MRGHQLPDFRELFADAVHLGCVALEVTLPLGSCLLLLEEDPLLFLIGEHLVEQVFSGTEVLSPLALRSRPRLTGA